MTEQLSLHYSPDFRSNIIAEELPEPLTREDITSLKQLQTGLVKAKAAMEKVVANLSKERLTSIQKAQKGGPDFNGTIFNREKQQPADKLLQNIRTVEQELENLLDSDPPPSRQKKIDVYLVATELLGTYKSFSEESE